MTVRPDPRLVPALVAALLGPAACRPHPAPMTAPHRPVADEPTSAPAARLSALAARVPYYGSPTQDGRRPGVFWANLSRPETRLRWNLEALTFHESVPGHHLQIALAAELADLPAVRRHADATAFVEGWAVYSERVADELGLYSSERHRLGMLNYQAWRASRLVVDTGIHELGWTRERAVAFMTAHTVLPPNEIENEVDRYVVWPGQALAYMIGALEIRRLRARAEHELGARFDLRAFHDVVVGSGAVRLPTLARVVDEWIASRAGR